MAKWLEAESIHIIREVVAEFKNPVMLYSTGKDSSVLIRLAQKAFFPGKFPFPLMHIDTGFKFPEMYEFRDAFCHSIAARLIVEKNSIPAEEINPGKIGADKCCQLLKTQGLLAAIKKYGFDAAFGGARREEEKSRAKERIFSVRDEFGQWNPKNQRPEIWDLYNSKISENQTVRIFPLSNWTELDIWEYIREEKIPVVPLYFAKKRRVIIKNGSLIPSEGPGSKIVECRFRSLGCVPCTGAVLSNAKTIDEIIAEVATTRKSERENRIIDLTSDSSMEQKKKEGYF